MNSDSQLLPLSALQHLLFCPRRCALIHLEQLWAENWRTVEGQHLHEKAHGGSDETREGVRIVRGLHLLSQSLGLIGKADIVEFVPPAGRPSSAAALTKILEAVHERYALAAGSQDVEGSTENERISAGSEQPSATIDAPLSGWTITPVEYKRGKPKANDCDRVQLCAQAICLEEMLDTALEQGFLFYGQKRRRKEVVFDELLRKTTTETAARLHAMIESRVTPKAKREKKCDSCSLVNLCLPGATNGRRSASRFTSRQFAACLQSDGPASGFAESETT